MRPCVLHRFPCSVLQCFPLAVFSHHQRATIGHNMPKYAKIGYKGLNKQKTQKKTTKKKQRFLETVGIGGMSLVFLFFLGFFGFLFFLVFFVFFCFFVFFVFSGPKGRMQSVESCHLFFFLPVNAYVKTENV